MAIAAAAKRLRNLARLLGTVAVAKEPGNLRGSLFKPPEVDEPASLPSRAPGVEALNTQLQRTVVFHVKQLENCRYKFAGYLAADSFCLRNRPLALARILFTLVSAERR